MHTPTTNEREGHLDYGHLVRGHVDLQGLPLLRIESCRPEQISGETITTKYGPWG